jgi:hypothetical protein
VLASLELNGLVSQAVSSPDDRGQQRIVPTESVREWWRRVVRTSGSYPTNRL